MTRVTSLREMGGFRSGTTGKDKESSNDTPERKTRREYSPLKENRGAYAEGTLSALYEA